ncbi:hypothetical protein D3C81_864850 [compost metagenome]
MFSWLSAVCLRSSSSCALRAFSSARCLATAGASLAVPASGGGPSTSSWACRAARWAVSVAVSLSTSAASWRRASSRPSSLGLFELPEACCLISSCAICRRFSSAIASTWVRVTASGASAAEADSAAKADEYEKGSSWIRATSTRLKASLGSLRMSGARRGATRGTTRSDGRPGGPIHFREGGGAARRPVWNGPGPVRGALATEARIIRKRMDHTAFSVILRRSCRSGMALAIC